MRRIGDETEGKETEMPRSRTTIHITKQSVMILVFLAAGILCTFNGVRSYYREYRYIPLEHLSAGNCKEGDYVAGMIERCATITVGRKVMGQSNAYSPSILKTYYFYTIPMNDGNYIRLMLVDEDTVDEMEKLIGGETESVRMEGQISREPVPPNTAWYEQSEQIKNPYQDVVPEVVIKQISFKKRHEVLYVGIMFLALVGLYIWQNGLFGFRESM